ncbi:hypothetical protein GUJ93_ZPchr0012g21629 [Zizania palustris]|uniref:Uncharacterized protein n=1 Tax=Zizania palustris TaxID=103762 RepID=A0A8J5WPC1_ZIZPA|nr:hypothetical protein GUJ93_ZPchr0012g21629 [Zizania palustris]
MEVECSEAKVEAVRSELRVMASEVEAVVPEPVSASSGLKGSQAYEIDFGGLFAPSEYVELSPIEEDEEPIMQGSKPEMRRRPLTTVKVATITLRGPKEAPRMRSTRRPTTTMWLL